MFNNGNKTTRAQVGIGALILFTAMLLVAVIAGGVLLDVGGFLQASGEQTGEQSSKQGSDRLQVLSAVGTVTNVATTTTDVIGIENKNQSGMFKITDREFDYFDSGATAAVSIPVDDQQSTLTSSGSSAGSNELVIQDGHTLRFDKDGSTLQITNEDTSSSISFDPAAENLRVKGGDNHDIDFNYVFDDPIYGQTTINIQIDENSAGISNDYQVRFEKRTESFVQLGGDGPVSGRGETLVISNGETVTAGSNTDGDLQNGDGDILSVSDGEDLTFTTDADAQTFTIENEAGTTLTVDGEGRLEPTGSSTVELQTDSRSIVQDTDTATFSQSGSPDPRYLFNRELPAADQRTDLAVTQLDLIVGGGPGAGDLDLESATVVLITDQGTSDLTYDPDFAVEDETFTASPITDDGDTFPVLTTGDRFKLTIDPGDLDPETDVFISISTVGGQETERIRIPASLLREGTISL